MRTTNISTLTASWEQLVRGSGGEVDRKPRYVAARSSYDVYNNALLLEPDAQAMDSIRDFYGPTRRWALWTADEAGDALAARAGLVRDGGTTDMACALDGLAPRPEEGVELADPGTVAAMNGLPPDIVAAASGFIGLVTDDKRSGLLLFRHADDVHLSFLATKAEHRRKGHATRLVMAALGRARKEGAETASLQSTPAAVSLYERVGFTTVGRWTEWVPSQPR